MHGKDEVQDGKMSSKRFGLVAETVWTYEGKGEGVLGHSAPCINLPK